MGIFLCKECGRGTMLLLESEKQLKQANCRHCSGALEPRRRWRTGERNPNSPPPVVLTVVEDSGWRPSPNSQPMAGWNAFEPVIVIDREVSDEELHSQEIVLRRGEVEESTMLYSVSRMGPASLKLERTEDHTSLY